MPSPPSREHRLTVRPRTRKGFADLFDLVFMSDALPVSRGCVVNHGDVGRVDEGEQLGLIGVLRIDRPSLTSSLEPKAVIGIQKHQVASLHPLECAGQPVGWGFLPGVVRTRMECSPREALTPRRWICAVDRSELSTGGICRVRGRTGRRHQHCC